MGNTQIFRRRHRDRFWGGGQCDEDDFGRWTKEGQDNQDGRKGKGSTFIWDEV